jgi:hypothetical protein
VVAAGAVEGWCLGYAQAAALRDRLRVLPRPAFSAPTAGAAALAYALAMLPATLGSRLESVPAAVLSVAGVVAGGLLLVSIGAAQWLVLHRIGLGRWWWVASTAGAWAAGLVVFMVVATPLWRAGQSLAMAVLVGVFAGALMAVTVAALTGVVARAVGSPRRGGRGRRRPTGQPVTNGSDQPIRAAIRSNQWSRMEGR